MLVGWQQRCFTYVSVTPQRGDTITAGSTVFRVMPFGPNDQIWQYHDRDRLYLRIHTKERT